MLRVHDGYTETAERPHPFPLSPSGIVCKLPRHVVDLFNEIACHGVVSVIT
jgi:hypothetical protein